jgi:hypothetical protein
MPNVESVRLLHITFECAFGTCVDVLTFHPECWGGQITGHPELIETDGAERCAECRRRLDNAE